MKLTEAVAPTGHPQSIWPNYKKKPVLWQSRFCVISSDPNPLQIKGVVTIIF